MNLIDKKLRDKIKNTYDLSISKKDTDQTTKKPIIEKPIDHTEYFKLFDESGVILFDKIYSDFNLQWKNNWKKNNVNMSNLASSSINFQEKNTFTNKENVQTESQKDSKRNNSSQRNNSNSHKKKIGNVGERLYNDVFVKNTKIETMRRLQEEEFKKMQIHKIPKGPKKNTKNFKNKKLY